MLWAYFSLTLCVINFSWINFSTTRPQRMPTILSAEYHLQHESQKKQKGKKLYNPHIFSQSFLQLRRVVIKIPYKNPYVSHVQHGSSFIFEKKRTKKTTTHSAAALFTGTFSTHTYDNAAATTQGETQLKRRCVEANIACLAAWIYSAA